MYFFLELLISAAEETRQDLKGYRNLKDGIGHAVLKMIHKGCSGKKFQKCRQVETIKR